MSDFFIKIQTQNFNLLKKNLNKFILNCNGLGLMD